jgi:hypothetical protein
MARTWQEWYSTSELNIKSSADQVKKATAELEGYRKKRDNAFAGECDRYTELHLALDDKVQNTYSVMAGTHKRMESLKRHISTLKECKAQLGAANFPNDAPLKLCRWRAEPREKRPHREHVRDGVDDALEAERAGLVDGQRLISEGILKAEKTIVELELTLAQLQADYDDKRHGLSLDEMCLQNSVRGWAKISKGKPLPVAQKPRPVPVPEFIPKGKHSSATSTKTKPTSPKTHGSSPPTSPKTKGSSPVETTFSAKNMEAWAQVSQDLQETAQMRDEEAVEVIQEIERQIQQCNQVASDCSSVTEKALKDQINANTKLRLKLSAEIQATQAKIDHAKSALSETHNVIQHLEDAVEQSGNFAALRTQRKASELIQDHVSTKLAEHKNSLLSKRQELSGQHNNEKTVLLDLEDRQAKLKDDLRDKTTSLHIDLNCLTHKAMHSYGRAGSLAKSMASISGKMSSGPGCKQPLTARPITASSFRPSGRRPISAR